jgi:hypothetical protein
MSTNTTHSDQLDLWKYFSDDAAKVKDKLWTIASWLFSLLSVVFGYIAQNLDGHGFAFKEPQIIIVVAGVGLVLSIYTCWMIYENGIHLRTAWNRTNHLCDKLPHVKDAWRAGKKTKDDDSKEEYREDLPPFVIRLMILGCLFALAFLVVLIAAVVQVSFSTSHDYNTTINRNMEYNIDIAAIIAATVWPIIILLVLFSKRFKTLVESLSSRITKLEVAGVKIEMPQATSYQPETGMMAEFGNMFEKLGAGSVMPENSNVSSLIDLLMKGKDGEYTVLDLGSGESWLTSRIYILSILFPMVKSVKYLVFVSTAYGNNKKFIGWINVQKMRWSLAMKYPHLEMAYQNVYGEEIKNESITTVNGRLGNNSNWNPPTARLLNSFVQKIKSDKSLGEGWVKIKSSSETWEQASWVTDILLRDIAGDELQTESVTISELRAKSDRDKTLIIANMEGRYVPVVNHEGRFEYLIDRHKLLERVAIQTLKP